MFSSAPLRPPLPPRYIVVSAITFEGFKLSSSNLIHALFIQISRTSSIIDIVVPSKMAAWAILSKHFNEMAINAIESDFRSSKMAAGGHFVKKKNAIENEYRTSKSVNQSEMTINAIKSDFRTSKMADGGHFVKI